MPDAPSPTFPSLFKRALSHTATLGPVGWLPWAPGTWGSAAAVAAAPLVFIPLPGWGRWLLLLAVFILGVFACQAAEEVLGRKDPSEAVIDEVLGQWLALLPLAQPTPVAHAPLWALAAGFALFRIFDIAKPWPIRWLEHRLPGGLGVMLDDVLAGIEAALILALVLYLTAPTP